MNKFLSEHEQFVDTCDNLFVREDAVSSLNTLNVIANLLWELGDTRNTSAVYTKKFNHGKLQITIDYRESNK